MRLLAYITLNGIITCETGMLIGGTDSFGIGGIDKQMIRESFRGNQPYIPGSSLKGKLRNLLEKQHGLVGRNGNESEVHSCKNALCPVCRVFGAPAEDAQTVTRLIVHDASLINASIELPEYLRDDEELERFIQNVMDYAEHSGGFTEIKTENVIDRTTGAAKHPRTFERVPAGMKFLINMNYRIFSGQATLQELGLDDTEDNVNVDVARFGEVIRGLRLLTRDYLGASGSRGYGRISIDRLQVELSDSANQEIIWNNDNNDIDVENWNSWADTGLLAVVSDLESAFEEAAVPDEGDENQTEQFTTTPGTEEG